MTKQQIKWECKAFVELSPIELYAILHLRMEVFVIEQNCIFQDNDYKDPKCHHLMAWDGHLLVAMPEWYQKAFLMQTILLLAAWLTNKAIGN